MNHFSELKAHLDSHQSFKKGNYIVFSLFIIFSLFALFNNIIVQGHRQRYLSV